MNSSSHLKYGSNELDRNLNASFQQSQSTSHSHFYLSQQVQQQQTQRNHSSPVSSQHLQNNLFHQQHQQHLHHLNSLLLTSDEIINFPMTDELSKILRMIDNWYTIDCRQLPTYFAAVAQRSNYEKDSNTYVKDECRVVNSQRKPTSQNRSIPSPIPTNSTTMTTTSSNQLFNNKHAKDVNHASKYSNINLNAAGESCTVPLNSSSYSMYSPSMAYNIKK